MTTGTFNDTSSDGHAVRERLVVLQIGCVIIIKEVIDTVVNGLPSSPCSTSADASCDQAGFPAQDLLVVGW